jgi:hypothetical protein
MITCASPSASITNTEVGAALVNVIVAISFYSLDSVKESVTLAFIPDLYRFVH